MAAGAVVFYMKALEDMMKGLLDLSSRTMAVSLVSAGYTPVAKSDSAYSTNAAANVVTAAGYADKVLASQTVAIASVSYVTFDAADTTLSATGTIKAKYALIYCNSGNQRLVAYFDTETTQTTGVEVTQLIIQWNALGIAQLNNPSA